MVSLGAKGEGYPTAPDLSSPWVGGVATEMIPSAQLGV